MNLETYAFVGILSAVGIGFPIVGLLVAWLLRPKKPNPIKKSTYECGVETMGDTWVQFKAQYYLFALIFVIFDIEAVFLFPWAVAYGRLDLWALLEVVIFIVILVGGLAYAWRKNALEWQ
ncbi:NADH-quinone oxidoreductase subunit A [Candidatus Amarolinea aalborgensis]|jgi:NADH-quinone oxidoreductase subunit A|uniref:NADH-quinone oxidoreductase subunit A n=1 Tax=Candidatus Amarolinea aalborgensis TaxID=2249329 RepID=UPI003BF9F735